MIERIGMSQEPLFHWQLYIHRVIALALALCSIGMLSHGSSCRMSHTLLLTSSLKNAAGDFLMPVQCHSRNLHHSMCQDPHFDVVRILVSFATRASGLSLI